MKIPVTVPKWFLEEMGPQATESSIRVIFKSFVSYSISEDNADLGKYQLGAFLDHGWTE